MHNAKILTKYYYMLQTHAVKDGKLNIIIIIITEGQLFPCKNNNFDT
jgi:hypothetical protein